MGVSAPEGALTILQIEDGMVDAKVPSPALLPSSFSQAHPSLKGRKMALLAGLESNSF